MLMRANSESQSSAKTRWQRFAERRLLNVVMGLMVATLCAAVLFPYVAVTVPPGHVGVLWKRIGGFGLYCWCFIPRGTVLEPRELKEEGLHIIWPWDELFIYDLRLQTITRSYNAISQDGVSLSASISARFQLQHDSVAQVHKFIGPKYAELVVTPVIGSRARDVISKHGAEDVYSRRRSQIQDDIRDTAQTSLTAQLNRLVQPQATDQLTPPVNEPAQSDQSSFLTVNKPQKVAPALHNSIQILDTLVLGIELPPAVVGAINRKIEQLYVAQEFEFRVQRERQESLRKAVEAAGIRDFQQTVSQGISDSYLRWRGIEATLQLAQSNNAKIVIVGGGKDGLPIILGNVDTPPPARSPAGGAEKTDGHEPPARPGPPVEKSAAPAAPAPEQHTPLDPAPPSGVSDRLRSILSPSLSEVRSMLGLSEIPQTSEPQDGAAQAKSAAGTSPHAASVQETSEPDAAARHGAAHGSAQARPAQAAPAQATSTAGAAGQRPSAPDAAPASTGSSNADARAR
jgi:regulator of protease activity HflC (stomatin/prohibitin superfamily)